MKKHLTRYPCKGDIFSKIMKLTLILSIAFTFQLAAAGYSQVRLDIHKENIELRSLIREIEKKTEYRFFYSLEEIKKVKNLNINESNIAVDHLLDKYLKNTGITFEIVNETIVLKPQKPSVGNSNKTEETNSTRADILITGKVLDESGDPMVGVVVSIKGSPKGTVTDNDGVYKINIPEESSQTVLIFRFLGYETQEIPIGSKSTINVRMKVSVSGLDEFVVTGIVERERESFTGAVASFTGEELKAITNSNAIDAIKSLDPSVVIFENNQFGSNPNVLPNIEVRGQTSISTEQLRDEFGADPNQPLFILDGFETNLRTIVDLDINRIKSITILKDAASTALYGSVAANGVIVVETKQPEVGKILLTYTGDYRLDMPDLSQYNMMNAEEKLEFERLSGRYTPYYSSPQLQLGLDNLYHQRLEEVRRGVNTYWLSEPVRLGITNSHTLYADGGTEELRFGVSVNYRNNQGVLKGSGRETWQGAVDLIYRKNKLNISNKLFVNGFKAEESPYGNFSDFVNTNPYFRKYNADGGVNKYLESGTVSGIPYDGPGVPNPLYNALLDHQFNTTSNFNVQNNLQLIYQLADNFRLQGMVQLLGEKSEQEDFLSPLNSAFDIVDVLERGRYNNAQTNKFLYRSNIMAVYSKVINKHSFTANARAEIQSETNSRKSFRAVGFPVGVIGNPAFSFSYQPNSRPTASYRDFRRVNVLASINYSFDQRYLFDATYRLDGSTAFGRNNPYSPFWAIGAGWNLHNEPSLKGNSAINNLRLRGNIGITGNQSFGNITSMSVYNYFSQLNVFGQGIGLSTLGNPDLQWQRTRDTSIGLDFGLFNNRFSGFLNVYSKITDPLIIILDQPASTGIKGVPLNIGMLDGKGVETNFRFSPIFRPREQIVWTVGWMGNFIIQEYDRFDNKLDQLNEEQFNSSSLVRYRDGFSPTDIWAVKSLGIDPATGREVFQNRFGESTYYFDAQDIVRVGNTRPVSEGVISTNISYKGFLFNAFLRYRVGGDVFNSALYNKVENIGNLEITQNQDRRALTERWREPGDVSQFKSIRLNDFTPMSSRFVQRENIISGESISFGYQWPANSPFIQKMGMQRLRVNAYMNDIFRLSTVRVERGIQYPFARTVSLSVNATF
ncbi:SusC/RagA family TonB-linked outer membrane protein [Belliella marina]|uniref:SusC/RagA family TonB-linked outer membrane protein n=1 Tax=Belliella marina TaxID=1644146 RepID=A0ABW4VPG7_9BACT